MADVLTSGGLSYVPLASGFRDSGGAPVPQAYLIGISDGTKVVPLGPGASMPVTIVAGGGGGGSVQDTAAEAALGAPADAAWGGTGSTSIVAALKAIWGLINGTLKVSWTNQSVSIASGQTVALSAGSAAIGSVSVSNLPATQTVIGTVTATEVPFQPIPAATTALLVGPTATTAPMALAQVTAATYRIRNAATSASPVAWRISTSGTSAVAPIANSVGGTGGTAGDQMIDPGGVEVFSLTTAQQTAIAAGTLYLSAITPAGGSATIYVTPGVAGA